MDPEWVEHLRLRCADEGLAFFFKQWGGRTPKARGRELHGRTFDEMPVATSRWPALAD
jgi:protein gp37